MECITHTIEKKLSCTKPSDCSDILRKQLEIKFNCKLMAENPTDIVNGALSINHTPNKHVILIDFYTKDENPKNTEHESTLKKLNQIPSKKQCMDCFNG